ncbi:phosphotransferase family protein [Kribbella sp. VKM Ac-2568]|uniref:phosphotransferase family protein n=1 Tax=Kribbella sp. VKM Ac-2568 TaxID=2512219 RepID=UPI0013050D8F|nr:aminoglycoside phosphotransferase family protein [Kribbella sp. VKM Ac-2568]
MTSVRGESSNLTVDTVVSYLIEQGVLSVAAIVASDVEVIDVGRRNQNLKIVRRSGPSHLLKQAGAGESTTERTVHSEAAFYNQCQIDPDLTDVRAVIPKLHHWDADRSLLLTELIDGQTLWAHYAAASTLPSESAAALGTAIGTIHRTFRQPSSHSLPWIAGLPTYPPWVLLAHRPTPDMFARLSPANLQVLKLIQIDRTMVTALDGLRRDWTADTIIHNDLKGDNLLVTTTADGGVGVHIVDWELISVGDAAWDVGSVFRDFLDYWLLSVPLSGDLTPEEMLQGAQIPLAKLHPAIRAFWNAYRAAAEMEASVLNSFLLRSVRLSAARMVQGAYELSLSTQNPPNVAYGMLQLALNILSDPRDASLHLFGLPLPWRKPSYGA